MPRRLVDLRPSAAPLLDIVSHARRGPGRRDRISSGELEHIARTVRRTPEVMVKVLSKGGQDLRAIRRHLDYLRFRDEGELALETDQGERVAGDGAAKALLEDWDLDLEEHRRRADLEARPRRSGKLVHKVMFSMPAGTAPEKVLAAVQNFAREEFALKHRYAMVLHTDEPHPHVHLVLKAVSEQGERLHIRKATLREWRWEFARHLRALGVPANATERAVRGNPRSPKLDGIYRAEQRGDSHRTHDRVHAVASELLRGRLQTEPGKARILETREAVQRGWEAVSERLLSEGRPDLAAEVTRFAAQMPPARTDREQIADALRKQLREARARTEERTR
jgi:Relaxase/Mobilisation nuclease domain